MTSSRTQGTTSFVRTMFFGLSVLASAPILAGQQTEPRIAPRDQITVTVFNVPEISGKFPVDSDGVFVHPLIGAVNVKGMTVHQAEDEVAKRLRDGNIMLAPHVTIELQQTLGKQVSVTGAVRNQGTVTFASELRLYDALVKAGMPTEDASEEGLIVRPATTPGGEPELLSFDIPQLRNGDPQANLLLQDGDRIVIRKAQQIYITGYVNNPNAYMYTAGMTVRQALALAGDISEKGTTRGITIWRKVPGKDKPEELKNVKLTDPVKPGDTINVRKSMI